MMGLVIRLLGCAVRVFVFMLLILLICLSQWLGTQASESLQILFVCLKRQPSTQSELPSSVFLCWQVFPRSGKEMCSLICIYIFLIEIGFLYKFQSGLRPGDCTIKSATTIGPGRGRTSYLTDFDETWPVLKGLPKTTSAKV